MTSLAQFAVRIRHIAVRIPERADEAVRHCALAVDQVLATETPVQSGRARSNWLVSFNRPNMALRPDTLGPAATVAQIAEARAVIALYQSGIHRSIIITNGLPYINRLNQGWSKQAPAGYVERAVMKGALAVHEIFLVDPP